MITTARLVIRPMRAEDAVFIIQLLNEPDFIKNIADKGVRTEADAISYIEDGPLLCQKEHGYSLMTVLLHSGEPVGMCGLLKREQLASPDLGYAYLSQYYGQGIAYEAAQAVLDHFKTIRPILAITSQDNVPSQNLLQKLGFNYCKQEIPGFEPPTTSFELT